MAEQVYMNFVVRAFVALLPLLLGLFFVLLVNMPVSFTGGMIPAPQLALAPVYFWSLVRPDLMPPVAALLIGLAEDLLSGGAPGVWTGGFLAAYMFTDRERDSLAGLSGFGAVLGFGAAMFIAGAVAYLLAALAYWQVPPVGPLLLQCAVTTVFYPIIAWFMNGLHRRVIGPGRSD